MTGKQILRLNGIPTTANEKSELVGYVRNEMGEWVNLEGDRSLEIDSICVRLHDWTASELFGDIRQYHLMLPATPQFLDTAGLNSESPLSRELFEKFLSKFSDFPDLNKFLYLYDVRKLIASIQECSKEVKQLVGEFYRILNCEPFFVPAMTFENEVRWSTSPAITMLWATLGFIFIRLHSLLDYIAKLAREAQSLKTEFKKYPKLVSLSFLYGSRKKLRINNTEGTLFEDCSCVHEIELIRNHIIHDGLLDDMPKGYEVYENGNAVERFLLMPDRFGKQFDRYVNRCLFYGTEDKINLRLPQLIEDFQARLLMTLQLILDSKPTAQAT